MSPKKLEPPVLHASDHATELINATGEKWISWQITPGINIIGTTIIQKTFLRHKLDFGPGFKPTSPYWISSCCDKREKIIVDDGLKVNGRWIPGFEGVFRDPLDHLNHDPFECYHSVDWQEVTNDFKYSDGIITIELVDTAGVAYCSSPLYLITIKN
jgi:hypothetical protein